jgi:dynein heavy chain, axonemal
VPTVDSIRVQYLLKSLLMKDKHTLIVGPTGTGKSLTVVNELKLSFQSEAWTYLGLSFSAQTTAAQTQLIIDGGMEKKRKGVYGPPLGKEGIIFVDDLNMPQKEKYGAQPPIELLRQWMDYGGWYDFGTPDRDFRATRNVRFCAAMGPPGGGRASITNRYVRHFNIVYVEPYSVGSMNAIYGSIMDWMFRSAQKQSYPASVEKLKENVVSSTIEIYNSISKEFRPTPAKSHYTYNLRDVSKVFQGLAKSHPRSIQNEDSMIKLWAHECLRVFQDRLISTEDRDKFTEMMQVKMKEKFKKDWDKLVLIKPLLFASFTPLIYPDGDETKKPWNDIYCELTDRDKVKKTAEEGLADYNVMNRAKKMDLVLFTDAIEHIVKIHRIITTELGHALLVGVGGSGRKSLSELATFIANYTIEVLEMAKGYSFNDWREDMKNKLFFASGYEGLPYVFLFSDTQIINESFVEDINNILNNGEIPNIYNAEDYTNIIESVKEANKLNPEFKAISEDNNQVYNLFVKNARNNIHLCLAMSPIGDDFKRRLRMFPSLVNCCAIDWFLPWPQEALQSVATVFLQ